MACFFASAYSVDIFLSISKSNSIPCRCSSIHMLIQGEKKKRKTVAPTVSIVKSLYLQVTIFKTGKEGRAYLQLLI
jgi:hypothetical protein